MRLYLDNCSFNRPFDEQIQLKIKLETEAKQFIQMRIISGIYELVWSYVLEMENNQNPFEDKRNGGMNMLADTVLRDSGMKVLKENLGLMEAERFITLILREPFDYTKWRQSFVEKFENMSVEEVSNLAMQSYNRKPS